MIARMAVVANASGWVAQGATHPTLVSALDAEVSAAPRDLDAHLRSERGEAIGRWLWLDAGSDGLDEAHAGARIDAQTVADLAASLERGTMPLPITGGLALGRSPSAVHGGVTDSATPANGWAHRAAVVLDEEGASHLYLYAELLPDVAADVVSGRLAYGSIEMVGVVADGVYRQAELLGHALTNAPANRCLRASSGVVSASQPAVERTQYMSRIKAAKSEEKKPEAEEVAEDVAAAAEAPTEDAPTDADKDETIAALEAKIAALMAQLDALSAESEEAEVEMAAARRARDVVAASGVHPSTRALWEDVVRKSGENEFAAMTRGLRAVPRRVAAAKEHGAPSRLDEKNSTVIMMRAAGISDATIAKHLVDREV